MNRQALMERTVAVFQLLPPEKAGQISAFAEAVLKQHEASQISKGIQSLTVESEAFHFLNAEEALYSLADA